MPPAESQIATTPLTPIATRRRQALAVLAKKQYGSVARAQLLRLGFSNTAIANLIADGTLHPIARGVYAVGHPHLTREGWWSFAVRLGGDDTLLGHRTAGALRGLLRAIDRTDIIVPVVRGAAVPHIRAHRSTIADADRDEIRGLPVTGLGRTLLDVAATDPRRLVEALEQAVILEVYDRAELLDVIARHRGHRGVARLREAIAVLPDDPAQFRSHKEREARDLIVAAGLPEPTINAWFVTGAGGGYELDLYWPQLRKNVEIDGPRHDLPWQMTSDRLRDAALARRGVEVQRHRVEVLDQAPAHLVAEIRAFLGGEWERASGRV